jgi:hypothetical protein
MVERYLHSLIAWGLINKAQGFTFTDVYAEVTEWMNHLCEKIG